MPSALYFPIDVRPWQRNHFGSANGLRCELQEQILRRAYELYEQCGRDDGMNETIGCQQNSEATQQEAKAVTA